MTRATPASRSLPVELTSFIGRGRELTELAALLERSRLLTLTGAGGSGKTRLALELVARREPDACEVAWVELAATDDATLVPLAVARAFGAEEEAHGRSATALVDLLRPRTALLVLDNCEHIVDECAALVTTLLQACPDLRILATSREALGVRGERAWLVPPLPIPGDAGTAAEIIATEAVRLFEDRARDVIPDFRITGENAAAVAEICRRLDGIPLAIELAAARVRVLPPAQLRDRLDDAFRLLTTNGRTTVPRHRTLRAAIDWSHDLLAEPERVLFRRLSVFRGGFTLDAAEQVGAGEGLPGSDVLDSLTRLVDRSLVVMREHHGTARYHLLETIRQYATQRLGAAGEDEEAGARERHALHMLRVAREAEPHLTRRERPAWVDRLLPELENIREALGWSRRGAPHLYIGIVSSLWWFWYSTRHWTEAGRWIEEALALPEAAASPHRASLLFASGALAALQSRGGFARERLAEAQRLAQAAGDESLEAYAANYLGMTYAAEGRTEAFELCGRAADWFRAHDDLYGLRLALLLQGSAAVAAGDLEGAERLNAEGVDVARRFGHDRELAIALGNLAVVLITRGEMNRAGTLLREAMGALHRDPSLFFIALALQYMGEVLGHSGRVLDAARLLGGAEAARETIGTAGFQFDRSRLAAALPGFRAVAGEVAFDRAWADGRATAPETLVAEFAADGATAEPASAPIPGQGCSADVPGPVSAPDADLRILALGTLEVHVNGSPLGAEAWSYAKPKELLLFLAVHPGGDTRDRIGEALWPGAGRAQTKNSFHVTLHHLRKALGQPGWIVMDGDRYRLAPDLHVICDASEFETAMKRALRADPGDAGTERLLRDALALYRGHLGDGLVTGHWLQDEADRLRRLWVDGSLRLARIAEGAGRTEEAAGAYERIVVMEELNEEACRGLMRTLAGRGDPSRALRHFERLRSLLADELESEPEPDTLALAEVIRSTGTVPGAAHRIA